VEAALPVWAGALAEATWVVEGASVVVAVATSVAGGVLEAEAAAMWVVAAEAHLLRAVAITRLYQQMAEIGGCR